MIAFLQRIAGLRGLPLLRHGGAVVILAWVPMTLVVLLAHQVAPKEAPFDLFSRPLDAIAGGILLAPLIETYGMQATFFLLRKFSDRPLVLCGVSAPLWGLVHMHYEGWGLHAAWGFFVMGICYLSLEKVSRQRAFFVTAAIHSACNALSYALYLIGQQYGF